LGIALRVVAGLAVGAALSEVAFRSRDHGAFPHLNLYAPDAELGVRLLAGESMKLAFGGNPLTTVRVNGDGLRGEELGAPSADEVLVLGDSQVFGLGVEENETASAKLQAMLPGAKVVNAGVPTYGPPEYEKVLAEMLAKRKPKRVIYVVNMANDLFEAERPNRDRHSVWDGWAVRRETAPSHVAGFPMRDALFRKSHAIFALRRWWYLRGSPVEAFSAPSEGTFRDIGEAAARAAEEHLRARDDGRRLLKLQEAKAAVANADIAAARSRFVELLADQKIRLEGRAQGAQSYLYWDPIAASFAQPGDIVGSESWVEWSRPIYATVELILQGAELRRKIEATLRDKARAAPKEGAKIDPVLDEVEGSQKRAEAIRAEPLPKIRAWSPLAPSLRRAQAMCEAAGARLFVAVLPIDVQVSKDEWAKYGREPMDLAPAQVLVDDVIDAADEAGATPVDLTPALRAAEPGAFLKGDLHMSPKGQEAMARALAEALAAPPRPKLPMPRAGRPLGRTPPTQLSLARSRNEVTVPGSSAAGCETYIVDEWLTLRCHDHGNDKAPPLGVKVRSAPLGEAVIYRDKGYDKDPAVVVQVAVTRGVVTMVDFRWPTRSRRLDTVWDGNKVTTSFHPLPDDEARDIPDVAAPRPEVCAALKDASITRPCDHVPFLDNPACFTTYKGDAASIAGCLFGDRAAAPSCPRGQAPVGVFQRCLPLCGKEAPCAAGKCSAYEGGEVCL
jgi:hypothetical protein